MAITAMIEDCTKMFVRLSGDRKRLVRRCCHHAQNKQREQRCLAHPVHPAHDRFSRSAFTFIPGGVHAFLVEPVGALDTRDDVAVTERQHRVA